MKRFFYIILLLFPFAVHARETRYPWQFTLFGGGASLCDDLGCFGPSGYTFGGSFGRQFTERWSFELDGTYAHATENEAPRFDIFTGQFFVPQLQRSRIWGGATFMADLKNFRASNLFIAIGGVGAYERQSEKTPPDIFHTPTKDLGVKGGVSGGAGLNLWISHSWGIRPEVRFYATPKPLSGLRYSAGIMKRF